MDQRLYRIRELRMLPELKNFHNVITLYCSVLLTEANGPGVSELHAIGQQSNLASNLFTEARSSADRVFREVAGPF